MFRCCNSPMEVRADEAGTPDPLSNVSDTRKKSLSREFLVSVAEQYSHIEAEGNRGGGGSETTKLKRTTRNIITPTSTDYCKC